MATVSTCSTPLLLNSSKELTAHPLSVMKHVSKISILNEAINTPPSDLSLRSDYSTARIPLHHFSANHNRSYWRY